MTRAPVPIAVLYSRSGPYAGLGREAVDGLMTAIAEVNADAAYPFRLSPVICDPGGVAETYGAMADATLKATNCRHVVGTITSWSRKEVIPVVERHDALLWYAFPYEGYEANDHVLYFGACPNQHLLPLFAHVVPRFGDRPFLIGSDYIWGWEINRIARECIEAAGGAVLGERYVPLNSVSVDPLIDEIRSRQPDFVLSNLVGPAAQAFVRAYHGLGRSDPAFAPSIRPIVSCNATETDIAEIGAAAEGLIVAAIYFDVLATPENRAFKARLKARHGADRQISGPYASVYSAVSVLAAAIREAGTDAPAAVRAVVTARPFDTPLGRIAVDPKTHHAALRPHIGRARDNGQFEVFESAAAMLPADPYLLDSAPPGGLVDQRMIARSSGHATLLKVVK